MSFIASVVGRYIFIPTDILQGIVGFTFFVIGNSLFVNKVFYKPLSIPIYTLLLFSMILSFMLGGLNMAGNRYSCFPINVVSAVGFVLFLYKFLNCLLDKLSVPLNWLIYIGKITILILCVHNIEFYYNPYNDYFIELFGNEMTVAIRVCLTIMISVILSKNSFIRNLFVIKD